MRRKIPDYPEYEATDTGEIISLAKRLPHGNHWRHLPERVLKFGNSFGGYRSVALVNEDGPCTFNVHKLVMLTFVGPANGLHINHKNGNRLDNRLVNLEYVTQAENNQHAREVLGARPSKKIVYDKDTIAKVLYLYNHSVCKKAIARKLEISLWAVVRIINEEA